MLEEVVSFATLLIATIGTLFTLQAKTGWGKTLYFPGELVRQGQRVLVALPTRKHVFHTYKNIRQVQKGTYRNIRVGYAVGGEPKSFNQSSQLVYVTVGWLSAKLLQSLSAGSDKFSLNQFDVVILDEAHYQQEEYVLMMHSINELYHRDSRQPKIVLSSATLPDMILNRLDNLPDPIELKSQYEETPFPISIEYKSMGDSMLEDHLRDILPMFEDALHIVQQEYSDWIDGDTEQDAGVLLILPGRQDIEDMRDKLKNTLSDTHVEIISIYAGCDDTPPDTQNVSTSSTSTSASKGHDDDDSSDSVFKIYLGTDMVSTGFTFPIDTVIDFGIKKIMRSTMDGDELIPATISQQDAIQRKGRVGRMKPGRAVRLYSQRDYDRFPVYSPPDTQLKNPSRALLSMKSANLPIIKAVDDFGGQDRVNKTFNYLTHIEAMKDDTITPFGKMIVQLPYPPSLTRMISMASSPEEKFATIVAITMIEFYVNGSLIRYPMNEEVRATHPKNRQKVQEAILNELQRSFKGFHDLEYGILIWNKLFDTLKKAHYNFRDNSLLDRLYEFSGKHCFQYDSLTQALKRIMQTAEFVAVDPIWIEVNDVSNPIKKMFVDCHSQRVLICKEDGIYFDIDPETGKSQGYLLGRYSLSHIPTALVLSVFGFKDYVTTRGKRVKTAMVSVPMYNSYDDVLDDLRVKSMVDRLQGRMNGQDMADMMEAMDEMMNEMFAGTERETINLRKTLASMSLSNRQQKEILKSLPRSNPFGVDCCPICQKSVPSKEEYDQHPDLRWQPIKVAILTCKHLVHAGCLAEFQSKRKDGDGYGTFDVKCPSCTVVGNIMMVAQWMPPKPKSDKPKKLVKQIISLSNAAESMGMTEEEFRAQIQAKQDKEDAIIKAKRDAEEEARREKIRKERQDEKNAKKLAAKMKEMKDAARKRQALKK